MRKEPIEFYAECIRKGDDPEAVLRVAIADHNEPLTPSEVEADFQGRHNRENLGNVIGWVIVDKDDYSEFFKTEELARAAVVSYDADVWDVFPVVRTL